MTIIKAANRQGVGGIGNISFSEFTFQQLIFNVSIVLSNLEYVKILVVVVFFFDFLIQPVIGCNANSSHRRR